MIRRRFMMPKGGEAPLFGYVTDGLQLLLDGEHNTRSGHNATAMVWEDLSGNNADWSLTGAVINADYLYFDGTMSSYGSLIDATKGSTIFGATFDADGTIELVCAMPNTFRAQAISASEGTGTLDGKSINFANNQNNYTVQLSTGAAGSAYYYRSADVIGQRTSVHAWRGVWGASLSAYCNNQLLQNGYSGQTNYGKIQYRIGNFGYNDSNPIHIYSIRVYNRILTAEEMAQNYAVDAQRFTLGGTQ